jgi:ArsR family transcriptional regulator
MQDILTIFKALSDETRLRVLKLLEHGELCVCDIFSALDMIQPKVSFHLSVLKEAGLITDRKEGRWVHYRIDDSDLLRRFLVLTAFQKISEDDAKEDKDRLRVFLESKKNTASRSDASVTIKGKSKCCGR